MTSKATVKAENKQTAFEENNNIRESPNSSYRQEHCEDQDVLARWNDGLFYLGKILKVDNRSEKCYIKFEDDSEHWALFKDIQKGASGGEIICCLCRNEESEPPNEIVLCDNCGLGYHQGCHNPLIADKVLNPDVQWLCRLCVFAITVKKGGAMKKGPNAKALQMLKQSLPYDLSGLTWDGQHKINTEQCYCYCGGPGDWYLKMLQCCRCRQWFHEACIQCLDMPLLYGDRFFIFVCSCCNCGPEYIKRLEMKWVDITQLGLFNLTIKFNKMYFEADDVVSWINQYWDYMKEGQAEPTPRHKRGAKCLESFDNHKTKFKCGREIKKRMSWWALRIRLPPQPPTIILPSAGVITDEVMNSLQMKGKRTKTFVPVQCLSPVPLRCKRKSSLDLEEVVEVKSKKAKLKLTEAIKNSCETKYSLNQNYKGYYGRICSDEFERSSICKLDSIIPRPVSFDGHNHPFKTVLEKQDELKKSKMKAEILNFYQNADDCITDTIAETESHTSQSSTVSSLSSPSVESSQPANNATETESLSSDSSLLTTSDKSRGNSRRGSRSSLSRTSNCDQASPQQTNGQISPKQFKSLLRSPDVVDKAAIDAVSSHEVNIRQLQSRVSNYFGAADRLAQGEKFRVLARRESADKKVQYLVEWEGVMV